MNHTRVLPFLILLVSTAFSQTSNKEFSSQALQANCPVKLEASWSEPAKIVPVAPGAKPRDIPNEARLQIALSNPKIQVIVARITIHGFPIGWRMQPAVLYLPDDPAEITKTIVFNKTVQVGQSASLDFALTTFSTVISLNLDSLTYSDGSSWHPEKPRYCRAVGLPVNAAANVLPR